MNPKFKKAFAGITALVMTTVMVMTGCGGSSKESVKDVSTKESTQQEQQKPTEKPSNKNVTLKVWKFGSPELERAYMVKKNEEFEKKNPGAAPRWRHAIPRSRATPP